MTFKTYANQLVADDAPETVVGIASLTQGVLTRVGGEITAALVSTGVIEDGAITEAKLGDAAVSEGKLADAAVTEAKLGDAAVTEAKLDDSAVSTIKIANAAVTTAKIAAGAVDNSALADNSVTQAKIDDNAVGSAELIDGSVITAKIAAGAVTANELADGSVQTAKLAGDSVTTDKLAAGSVTTSILADGAATSDKIATGGVSTANLADDAVTSDKIADGAVGELELADSSVTQAKLSLVAPESANDAATKAYVDSAVEGLHFHTPVAVKYDFAGGGGGGTVIDPVAPPTATGVTKTVGTLGGEDFATLASALADAAVVDGCRLLLSAQEFDLSATLTVSKQVIIQGAGQAATVIKTTGLGVGIFHMINITTSNVVLRDLTISDQRATPTANDSALNISAGAASSGHFLENVTVNFAEFGVIIKSDGWQINNCHIAYTGPNNSTRRALGIYRSAGQGLFTNSTYDSGMGGVVTGSTRLIAVTTGSAPPDEVLGGYLRIGYITSANNKPLHQFFNCDYFAPSGTPLTLCVDNCDTTANGSTGETSAFLVFAQASSQPTLSQSAEIVLMGNTISNAHGKGMLALNGMSGLGTPGTTTFYASGNSAASNTFLGTFVSGIDGSVDPAVLMQLGYDNLRWSDPNQTVEAEASLSGLITVDGVPLVADDRVFVIDAADGVNSGIYLAASGAWLRASDFSVGDHVHSSYFFVNGGDTYANTSWVCTNDDSNDTVGTAALAFSQMGGQGLYQAGSGLALDGNTFSIPTGGIALGMIPDALITGAKLANATVDTAQIKNDAITQDKLADLSVGTGELIALSVTTGKLALEAVDTAQIKLGAVNTDQLHENAVTAAKMADGTITNLQVSASAAIAQSKISSLVDDLAAKLALAGGTMTGSITMSGGAVVNGLPDAPSANDEAASKKYVDDTVGAIDLTPYFKHDGSVAMTGELDAGTNKIVNVVNPTAAQHAATKDYVDQAILDADLTAYVKHDGSVAMTGALDMGTHKITNLVNPTAGSQEAATAKYVDDGLDLKVGIDGDTMTGSLTMSSGATVTGLPAASAESDAVSKGYAEDYFLGGAGSHTLLVQEGGRFASLQAAIDAAASGDIIFVGPKAAGWGSISLTAIKNLTIVGFAQAATEQKLCRVTTVEMNVASGLDPNSCEVNIVGLYIGATVASGALVRFTGAGSARLRMRHCSIFRSGAGDSVESSNTGSGSSFYIDNCLVNSQGTAGTTLKHVSGYTLVQNRTSLDDGAVVASCAAGQLVITDCALTANAASAGPAVSVTGGTVSMGTSTISFPKVSGVGVSVASGAIFGASQTSIIVGTGLALATGKAITGAGTAIIGEVTYGPALVYSNVVDATTVAPSIRSGGAFNSALSMSPNGGTTKLKITDLADPTAAQDAATKAYADAQSALKLSLTGGSMTGAIAMGTNKITGLGDPTLAQDAATKNYVDVSVVQSLTASGSVNVASNVVMLNTNGGITATLPAASSMSGKRVVVKKTNALAADSVVVSGGGLIDGAASQSLFSFEALTLLSDGSAWFII